MRYKLLGGLAVRRACYGVLRFVMESGALQRHALLCFAASRCPIAARRRTHPPSSPCPTPPGPGAKGCEVIVSGKLRAQRAKSMKFKDGYMVSSGNPVHEYIDSATRHVMLRQVRAGCWLPSRAKRCLRDGLALGLPTCALPRGPSPSLAAGRAGHQGAHHEGVGPNRQGRAPHPAARCRHRAGTQGAGAAS